MTRSLKLAGLTLLLAALTATALAATGALAEEEEEGGKPGTIVAFEYPLILDGSDVEGGTNAFTILGEEIECPESTYSAEVKEATSKITITPTYNNAKCTAGGGGHKATISMNGCDYLFFIERTTTSIEDNYFTTFDLVCPKEQHMEIHKYLSASGEEIETCKITIEPQVGIKKAKLTNVTSEGDITLETSFNNITASKSGLCGKGNTTEGEYDVDITFLGTNKEEEVVTTKIIDP